ncbi:MAG: hypothetical protein EOO16_00205 [Chitinophagaceae bacterium]|nr:MAG: hypothetical protein EOO16_00205 [Chitinophagaceae bacterium]
MKTKMRPVSRILVALASLSLSLAFVLPVWFIYLMAPQYPEGLTMNIWLDHLSGQVDIINGLNHYIGMKHISESMFPEFGYMSYVVGAFIVLGLLVAITGRRKHLFGYLVLLFIAAGAAMYDFYQWGYDYGHHLDPKAAIQVPGLYYQPPLLGHKKLLNFDAYSYPDQGGWVIIGAGVLFIAVWGWERFVRKNAAPAKSVQLKGKTAVAASLAAAALMLGSCKSGPEPFLLGRDACEDCKMTIADGRFGAELITRKGRIYKFDDLHCLAHFREANPVLLRDATVLFAEYNTARLIPSADSWSISDPEFKSPMNSNAISFRSEASALAAGKGKPVPGLAILDKL